MPTGYIKVRKPNGFGFIVPDEGGPDLFFHVRDLARGTDENLAVEGAGVRYEVRQGDRGLMARQVRINPAREAEPNGHHAPPAITLEEAFKGLDEALLAVVEWRDLLHSLLRDQAGA
jgi:cold shock CspA family protein